MYGHSIPAEVREVKQTNPDPGSGAPATKTPEAPEGWNEPEAVLERKTQMRDYLRTLFAGYDPGLFMNLRWLGEAGARGSSFIPIGELQNPRGLRPVWNLQCGLAGGPDTPKRMRVEVYVGVLPRVDKLGTKDATVEARWMWADLDFKVAGEAAVWAGLKRAEERGCKAEMLVHSGGGIHAYFRLPEPRAVSDPKTRAYFERQVRMLQQTLLPGCDPTQDCSRILRVPGMWNHKRGLPVRLLRPKSVPR